MSGLITAAMWAGSRRDRSLLGAGLTLRWSLSERLTGAIMGFGSAPSSRASATSWCRNRSSRRRRNDLARFAASALVSSAATGWSTEAVAAARKSLAGGEGGGSGTAIFLGTLLDGVPESMILGMGLATGGAKSASRS